MTTTAPPQAQTGPTSQVEHVTPNQAERWLADDNISNRNIREHRVAAYARDMTAGRWMFNGESLKFDIDGVLLDGQHRLAAVARSGVTAPFVVVRGLPPEAQDTVDIGAARTMADALSLRGEPGAAALAAIARRIVRWERGVTTQGGAGYVTPAEVLVYIEDHPELRRAVQVAQMSRGAVPAAPSAVASAYHLCASLDVPGAERFYVDQLIKSVGLQEGDPALALQRKLQRAMNSDGRQMHPDDAFRFAVLAWNHFRAGTRISKLQAPKGGWTAANIPIPK
ncbi:hypothetical protein ABZ671_00430 [Micromonospora sp. NPDC006766]|uniref:hypothetical protein n=1 Tax=Micromonospora sp. NPDC006766 TaxID=3154778 RepID=UPI0033D7EC41